MQQQDVILTRSGCRSAEPSSAFAPWTWHVTALRELRKSRKSQSDEHLPSARLRLRQLFLAQLQQYVVVGDFHEYAYFSSYSDRWLEHAKTVIWHDRQPVGLDHRRHGHGTGEQRRLSSSYFVQKRIKVIVLSCG